MTGMLKYSKDLKQEANQIRKESEVLKKANTEIKQCLEAYSDLIFSDIAKKLLNHIQESPQLTERLKELQLNTQDVSFKELIKRLDTQPTYQQSSDPNCLLGELARPSRERQIRTGRKLELHFT